MKYIFIILSYTLLIYSCKKKDETPPVADKNITSFSFTAASNPVLSADVTATIDQNIKVINVVLPAGISVISLKASFTASANTSITVAGVAQISGVTINNFTNAVTYSVSGSDNTSQDYKVIVTSPVVVLPKDITAFSLTVANNPSLPSDIIGTIDQINKTINLVFPENISLIDLKANFSASPNTTTTVRINIGNAPQISGVTKNNFGDPLVYRVTAQDNTFQLYAVKAVVTVTGPNVYVAGTYIFGAGYYKLWKNGVSIDLTPFPSAEADIYDMFVSNNNDTYVVGYYQSSSKKVAMLWKNGVAISLTNGAKDAWAYGVYVVGTDVYVAGKEENPTNSTQSTAILWKNGVATNLTSGLTNGGVTDVFAVGSDVYVCGYEDLMGPRLWKNGVTTNLISAGQNFRANAVFVQGNDVYVVGSGIDNITFQYKIVLWKNGVPTDITNPSTYAYATRMSISGSDVYILGYESNGVGSPYRPKYWKNGVANNITTTNLVYAYDFFILGNDVYVTGVENVAIPTTSTNKLARVWKNGLPLILNTTHESYGQAIFVK